MSKSKLEEQIAERAKEIRTDGYSMSIGEVLSMYQDRDIEVHPEFQRIFRWTPKQKSRLIESLLLGIPIPPIFVSQRQDGIWDVIDGVQRLSTIFEFVGVYRDFQDEVMQPSTLVETEYLPDLEGYTWQVRGPSKKIFSESLRRVVKRARIEFQIVQKESDANAKYDLFQRLNSGTDLSPQEARNCLLVMLNVEMFNEILELSMYEHFAGVVPLSDRKENEAYRQELVLRFFCQAAYDGPASNLRDEFGEYLTTWTRLAAAKYQEKDSLIDADLFRRVFRLLNETVGEDAFRRFSDGRHVGAFSISAFEFITSGLAANTEYWERNSAHLRRKIEQVWSNRVFRANSGSGVATRQRLPRLVLASRNFFGEG